MNKKSIVNDYNVTSYFPVDRASLRWKVENVSMCFQLNKCIYSPEFCSSDATWKVYIQPRDKDVFTYLTLTSAKREKGVSYNINLINDNDDVLSTVSTQEFISKVGSGHGGWAIEKTKLLENLQNDRLTVFCKLTVDSVLVHNPMTRIGEKETIPVHPTVDTSIDKLVTDLKNLFQNKKYCDVILLSSDGHKFPAHKAILEERSPVFGAMFQHDMAESRQGEVNIEDVDGSILHHLLCFIYTAKVCEISIDDIFKLYVASDKYHVEDLKKICIRQMSADMSVDNVCAAMVLANTFQEQQLKESAMSFLHKNADVVIKSDSWKDFMKEHSYLAAEILQTVLLCKKS